MKILVLLALLGVAQSQVLSVNTMRVCDSNTDCVAYGDLGAECDRTTGRCTCTTNNYKRVVDGTKTFYHCVDDTETLEASKLRMTEIVLGMTFPNAQCNSNATFDAPFVAAVQKVVPTAEWVKGYHQCVAQPVIAGSLGTYTAVQLRVPVGTLFTNSIENFQTLLQAELTTPQLTLMGATLNSLTGHTVQGVEFICPKTANAKVMATFSTSTVTRVCKAIECDGAGYEIIAGQDVCTLIQGWGGVFSYNDDEMSGGAIAGIVIGILAFIVIVVVVAICCFKKPEEDQNEDDSEAPDAEE
eukprot:TRINITY_DN2184_c1_g1_i1.p1 TRINITY_DN2184_c1_g1~~TRINITY_DN2184_c1_g1_i1.p1  ORF type:complete len:299 (+),score=83.27 TRINITY_DN2184_c1_g1_i1:51-947(+)